MKTLIKAGTFSEPSTLELDNRALARKQLQRALFF